jgi:hypothetical protein
MEVIDSSQDLFLEHSIEEEHNMVVNMDTSDIGELNTRLRRENASHSGSGDETSENETSSHIVQLQRGTRDSPTKSDSNRHSETDEVEHMEVEDQPQTEETGEVEQFFHDPNDVSRVDLEFIEHHMRHASSNAGPYYESDMPLVLGRDLFKRHDRHRLRGLISREHCRIESSINEEGELEYYVKDTSVNGTFLGPHRISPDGPGALVQHGDVIGLLTSHSSPIETYTAEGEVFKVTLGLRWLRPNHKSETGTTTPSSESHTAVLSHLADKNKHGVFAGERDLRGETMLQTNEGDLWKRSHRITPTATPPSASTPKHGHPTRHNISTDPKLQTSSKGGRNNNKTTTHKRKSLDLPNNRNHSGNDTDDTDGDDEMDLSSQSQVTPAAKKPRKPIITVSKPSFDEDDNSSMVSESSYKSSRTGSSSTKKKSYIKPPRGGRMKTAIKGTGTPTSSTSSISTSSSHLIAPGSYWNVTSRDKKRHRPQPTNATTDDLSFDEPATKIPKARSRPS